jgi:hypothetical protein
MYGVSFSRRLNQAASCTCSFALDSEGYSNADVLEATVPGKTGFYIDRGGQLVWGGILWSRTYQSQAKALSFTGQTFESFLYQQYIETTQTFVSTDQRNILRSLINYMQAKPYSNVGIVVPSAFTDHITRSTVFYDYEVWSIGKAIENLVGYADGFDYTLEPQYNSSGNPSVTLLTNDVLGSSLDSTGVVLDYPGNIKNYWFPENASSGATSVIGVGAGEGSSMLRTKSSRQDLLSAGYPDIQQVYTNKDVSVADTLSSQVVQTLNQLAVPITVPTVELNPQYEPTFGSFQLGDFARLAISDPRFPGGAELSIRIVGWDAVPSESDNAEALTLVVAGQE